MLLKVLVVNCEAVSCAAVFFMKWAMRFPFWAVACVHSPSDMICFFQLDIDGKGVVLRKCDWGKKYREGNLWQPLKRNAMGVKHKEKKRISVFFCGLVIFSMNTWNSWRTFAELHDGTTDGESSCLTCQPNLMKQDSLNVTAKFKATVEVLVGLHGTVACCLCRHFELLTALRMP